MMGKSLSISCRLVALLVTLLYPLSLRAQAPANDECTGAIIITTLPDTVRQNTRLATPNPSDPVLSCADGGGGKTVWFQYTPDSTGYVTMDSYGSTPVDTFDVCLAIFTGSCGSLVEYKCNDDVIGRQAQITALLDSGTTYYIYAGEWKGGGYSGGVPTGGNLVLRVYESGPVTLAKGPKSGSVSHGIIVSTGSMAENAFAKKPPRRELENENDDVEPLPPPKTVMPPLGPPGANYKESRRSVEQLETTTSRPVVLKSFQGIPDIGYYIPPDPIVAVGPNHIVACVNSEFRIWDKNGTVLKSFDAGYWFGTTLANAGPFDPKVLFDHHDNRWVMVWLDVRSSTSYFLISVSDDDNPLGTWYNWAIPSHTIGDSVAGNWSDYEGVGYDDQALYICSNQWGFSSGFKYVKVRIIPKDQLYSNTAGPLSWKDFWDLREPDNLAVPVSTVRPARTFGASSAEFLLNDAPYYLGTFVTLWTISNPITSPSIAATNIPVYANYYSPNASQPNPCQYSIEAAGAVFRNEPIYRDSSLWAVHTVASGTDFAYSSVSYLRLNPFTHTNMEDVACGQNGYWYYYPAIMADSEENLTITFTRSSSSEYAGAYLIGRRSTDPPGLSEPVPLKLGEASYCKDFGSQRNRWGDYNGIALDPSDPTTVWAFTEYAALPQNSWGTWVGKIKLAPVPGKFMSVDPLTITYDYQEIGTSSDTVGVSIANYGLDPLTITSITPPDSDFLLVNPTPLPVTLSTFEKISLGVVFTPKDTGHASSSLIIHCDDPSNPLLEVQITGKPFNIVPVLSGILYAMSTFPTSSLVTLDGFDAKGAMIGGTGYETINSIRVNPSNHQLYGLVPGATSTIVRINSLLGDAHPSVGLSSGFMEALAFRADTPYVGRVNGEIYRVSLPSGDLTQVASTGLNISGMDFNPISNELWVCVDRFGDFPDMIYKVDPGTGSVSTVGSTTMGSPTRDIAFDGSGNLWGLIGGRLCLIDTTTGAASIVGDVPFDAVYSLATDPSTHYTTTHYRFTTPWNLISVPLEVPVHSKGELFPTASSDAYEFNVRYSTLDSLGNGSGFWLRFNPPASRAFTGLPRTLDSVSVHQGWNLVGSLSVPVPVDGITSIEPGIIASNFYAYRNNGYTVSDVLLPNEGYWVKAKSAGKLIYDPLHTTTKNLGVLTEKSVIGKCNSLLVSDCRFYSQQLYFGSDREVDLTLDRFDLPPPLPDGSFDVRFGSGRVVEIHPAQPDTAIEYPVIVRSESPTVRISWHVEFNPDIRYTLVAAHGPNAPSTVICPLAGDGSIVLDRGAARGLRLRAEQYRLPAEFSLSQNYPNPFNPQTLIRYELPTQAFVTLVVYDILGNEVKRLVQGNQDPGYYAVTFDGEKYSSGVYFYRFTAGAFSSVQKMVLCR